MPVESGVAFVKMEQAEQVGKNVCRVLAEDDNSRVLAEATALGSFAQRRKASKGEEITWPRTVLEALKASLVSLSALTAST